MTLSRRIILGAGLGLGLGGLVKPKEALARVHRLFSDPDEQFDIATRNLALIPNNFRKRRVRYDTGYPVGTIVIDTAERYLYLQQENGRSLRYGVGIGRAGFSWSGEAVIQRKAKWPDWYPPAAMRRREPHLPAHMAGGIRNPLGARALYLYQNGRDTLYRIHGTAESYSIGQAVSSGCVRVINEEIVDLYEIVPIGTRVIVI
jgi:lipoprotein-anchoring transpeptidase ErfK/SrfK